MALGTNQFIRIFKNDLEKKFDKMYFDYEQKFNNLADGDLNGQDLWSTAGGSLVVANVGNFLPYEGSKSIKAIGDGAHAVSYSRPMPDHPTLGVIYFAMRKDDIVYSDFQFGIYDGVDLNVSVHFINDNFELRVGENEEYRLIKAGALANQWYLLAFEFDIPNNKVRAKINDGISWSAWTDWLIISNFASGYVDSIYFYCWPFPAGKVVYLDTITPTDPWLGPPSPYVWGLMTKSQSDPEKIEEAIARLISEHEANPDSHLGPGESLQSHRAAEIIDHLAGSVVADKLQAGGSLILYTFDNLDRFNKSGNVDLSYWPELVLWGDTGTPKQAWIQSASNSRSIVNFNKDFIIQFAFFLAEEGSPTAKFSFGSFNVGNLSAGIALELTPNSDKVHLRLNGIDYYSHDLNISRANWHTFRIFYSSPDDQIFCYLDDVLVATINYPVATHYDCGANLKFHLIDGGTGESALMIEYLLISRGT